MIVYRFMSKEEFDKYNKGELIEGRLQDVYKGSDAYNQSVVCFFSADNLEEAEKEAGESWEYMSGIASDEVCAIFEFFHNDFKLGRGTYEDPDSYFWDPFIFIEEVLVSSYSNKDFKLKSFCTKKGDFSFYDEDWVWSRAGENSLYSLY